MRGKDRRGSLLGWLWKILDKRKNAYYRYTVDWDRRLVYFADKEIGLDKVSSMWLTAFYGNPTWAVIEVIIEGRLLRGFYSGPVKKVEAMAILLEEDLGVPVVRGN